MAKVTITIEDKPDGKVDVKVGPMSIEEIARKRNSGHDLTNAEGYAVAAALRFLQISKENREAKKIIIPDLLRG